MVWNFNPSLLSLDCNVSLNFKGWLDVNVKNSIYGESILYANIPFITTLWSIWKAHNKFKFDDILVVKENIIKESNSFASSITLAFEQSYNPPCISNLTLINWKFPPTGLVKLNTDGSCMGNPGPAGFGGVARDDHGRWLEGFAGFIGKATILKSELWAVRESMCLIKSKGWMFAIVEVDSTNVVDLLKTEDVDNHPLRTLIQDCKFIMDEFKLTIMHTLWEGNRCADAMAKIGVNQLEKLEMFHHVPSMVKGLLEANAMATSYPRGF